MQAVGRYCSEKDHHPEWALTNGGKGVQVKLTSHFAGNKVTLFDFELAERMNEQAKISLSEFKMYPLITSSAVASLKIFFGTFFATIFVLNLFIHWNMPHPYKKKVPPMQN